MGSCLPSSLSVFFTQGQSCFIVSQLSQYYFSSFSIFFPTEISSTKIFAHLTCSLQSFKNSLQDSRKRPFNPLAVLQHLYSFSCFCFLTSVDQLAISIPLAYGPMASTPNMQLQCIHHWILILLHKSVFLGGSW